MMQRTNLHLPLQMLKRLRVLAVKQGISVAELVRRILSEAIK